MTATGTVGRAGGGGAPKIVTKLKSFIAERGYISYNYKKSALSSYVHGNLDAIEKSNNTLSPLGGVSFLHREYCLQHQLWL